jgi:hypothetical protein
MLLKSCNESVLLSCSREHEGTVQGMHRDDSACSRNWPQQGRCLARQEWWCEKAYVNPKEQQEFVADWAEVSLSLDAVRVSSSTATLNCYISEA